MEENSQDVGKTDNPLIIFLVGLTAGYIATTLPRLITYLSVAEDSVDLNFFSSEYFYASSLFAIVIGVSMVWLNYGKKESTKNLFMTALALPSIISGAINMSSTTVSGEASLKEMEYQYRTVEKALQEVTGLEEIPVIDLVTTVLDDVSQINFSLPYIPFINNAYAAENTMQDNNESSEKNAMSMGVQFKSRTQQKNYVVVVEQSKDLELIRSRLASYSQVLLIPDLKLKRGNGRYYIIQDIPRTKSFSLIEVLKLNKNYGLKTSLAKIK